MKFYALFIFSLSLAFLSLSPVMTHAQDNVAADSGITTDNSMDANPADAGAATENNPADIVSADDNAADENPSDGGAATDNQGAENNPKDNAVTNNM
ncbi:MAG: hypothetical protein KGJ95_08600 [Candidatus Omnitrophica bacterium]|nr:hypothetical protein [Candidatus Omnitrophota bacterium]